MALAKSRIGVVPVADSTSSHLPIFTARALRRSQAMALLFLGDLFGLSLPILAITSFYRGGVITEQPDNLILMFLPFYTLAAFYSRAYGREVLERWQAGGRRALTAVMLATLSLFAAGFAARIGPAVSRVSLAVSILGAAASLILLRFANHFIIRHLLPDGAFDVVLLSDGVELRGSQGAPCLDADALGLRPDLDSPYMLDRIGRLLRGRDRVIVACPRFDRERWATVLKGLGVEVHFVMPEIENLGMIGIGQYENNRTAVIAREPLSMWDMLLKRTFDIVVTLLCMPVLLLISVLVATAIKLDDGGPVFFKQPRIGHGNRIFNMIKFRSMTVAQADVAGDISTSRDDVRVTRVGRWLRSTSVDELPQLFNVLKGDMSIVGPRPHALQSTAEDLLFWEADKRYWLRHAVKPGLTGLAQVRGFRGATACIADLHSRVQADLEYLVGWSLWRDLRIVADTAKVLVRVNAY